MTLLEAYNLRFTSSILKSKTTTAIAKKAVDVLNENVATENHVNRVIWAKDVLANSQQMAERILWSVIADPAIVLVGEAATDVQILTAVTNVINVFALGV